MCLSDREMLQLAADMDQPTQQLLLKYGTQMAARQTERLAEFASGLRLAGKNEEQLRGASDMRAKVVNELKALAADIQKYIDATYPPTP